MEIGPCPKCSSTTHEIASSDTSYHIKCKGKHCIFAVYSKDLSKFDNGAKQGAINTWNNHKEITERVGTYERSEQRRVDKGKTESIE